MRSNIFVASVLFVIPAFADPRSFEKIHKNDQLSLILPEGQCDTKVVRRDIDQLRLRLASTTLACGPSESWVTLSRLDVEDVIEERPPRRRPDPSLSPAGRCTLIATVAIAMTVGQYLGETGSDRQALAAVAGGGIASAALCHGILYPKARRYSVKTRSISPAQQKR